MASGAVAANAVRAMHEEGLAADRPGDMPVWLARPVVRRDRRRLSGGCRHPDVGAPVGSRQVRRLLAGRIARRSRPVSTFRSRRSRIPMKRCGFRWPVCRGRSGAARPEAIWPASGPSFV